MKQISMVEAFVFSTETIKKHPLLILGPAILSNTLANVIPFLLEQFTLWTFLIPFLLLIAVFISAVFSIGLIRISCLAFDNQDEAIRWSVYKIRGKRALFIFVAYNVIAMLTGLIGSNPSSVLLYFLVFFIWLQFLFTPYLLVEKNMTLEESLRTSYWLTRGIKVSLVVFFFCYSLLAVFITLPLFLLFIRYGGFMIRFLILQPILLSFLSVAMVYIYKDISNQDENPQNFNSIDSNTISDLPKKTNNPDEEIRIPIESLMN